MSKIGHIIIPVDFSDQSVIALRQSYNLAKFSNAEIILLHVIDKALFERLKIISVGKDNYEHLLEKGINDSLNEIAEEARAKGIKVSVKIMHGKAYEKISELADGFDDSIIIMGTRANINFKKRFIGTNTLRVVKISPCPVITIHGEQHRDGCKNIILPLDIKKETKDKVSRAIDLAHAFDSMVTLVTVLDTNDEFIVNKLTRQMHSVKEILEERNVKCKAEFIKGDDIAKTILNYANKVNADLIMIMTQEEDSLIEYFIGSSAQEIINHSTIPVLSIHPIERKDTTEFTIQ